MKKYKVKFTATGEIIKIAFSDYPALSDIFQYHGKYYMVADYDGNFIHVVNVNKHEVTYEE